MSRACTIHDVISAVKNASSTGLLLGPVPPPAPLPPPYAQPHHNPAWVHWNAARLLDAGLVTHLAQSGEDRQLLRACAFFELAPEVPVVPKDPLPATKILLVANEHGADPTLRDAISSALNMGAVIYWIGHWNEPPLPEVESEILAKPNAFFLSDFDSDSALAYLLEELDQFPPVALAKVRGIACGTPGEASLAAISSNLPSGLTQKTTGHLQLLTEFVMQASKLQGETGEAALARARHLHKLAQIGYNENSISSLGSTWIRGLRSFATKQPASRADELLNEILAEFKKSPPRDRLGGLVAAEFAQAAIDRAQLHRKEKAIAILNDADTVLRTYTDTLASNHRMLLEWASLLINLAGLETEREHELYQEAAKLVTQSTRAGGLAIPYRWLTLAEILRDWGLVSSGEDAAERFRRARQAVAKFAESNEPSYLSSYNLGIISLCEARLGKDKREELMSEAESHIQDAIGSAPPGQTAMILNNSANALGEVALASFGTEMQPVEVATFARYAQAAEFDPQDHRPHKNWSALLLRAGRYPGALEQAAKAEERKPGAGFYNMACATACMGDAAATKRHLEAAQAINALPPPYHIEKDTQLDSMRNEPWFQEWFTGILP